MNIARHINKQYTPAAQILSILVFPRLEMLSPNSRRWATRSTVDHSEGLEIISVWLSIFVVIAMVAADIEANSRTRRAYNLDMLLDIRSTDAAAFLLLAPLL